MSPVGVIHYPGLLWPREKLLYLAVPEKIYSPFGQVKHKAVSRVYRRRNPPCGNFKHLAGPGFNSCHSVSKHYMFDGKFKLPCYGIKVLALFGGITAKFSLHQRYVGKGLFASALAVKNASNASIIR